MLLETQTCPILGHWDTKLPSAKFMLKNYIIKAKKLFKHPRFRLSLQFYVGLHSWVSQGVCGAWASGWTYLLGPSWWSAHGPDVSCSMSRLLHLYTLSVKLTFQEKMKCEKRKSVYSIIDPGTLQSGLSWMCLEASKNQAVGVRVSLIKWHMSVKLSSLRSCRWTCEDLVIGSFVH